MLSQLAALGLVRRFLPCLENRHKTLCRHRPGNPAALYYRAMLRAGRECFRAQGNGDGAVTIKVRKFVQRSSLAFNPRDAIKNFSFECIQIADLNVSIKDIQCT